MSTSQIIGLILGLNACFFITSLFLIVVLKAALVQGLKEMATFYFEKKAAMFEELERKYASENRNTTLSIGKSWHA